MVPNEIALLRLQSQQIASPQFKKPHELIGWMGMIQSQDFPMSKWAVGLRVPGIEETDFDRAFNKGEILRTHILRPTWHLVTPDDIYWMLDLSAPRIKALMKFRDRELELDEKIFKKCNTLIEKALLDTNHLTREEIGTLLHEKAKIINENSRLAHILVRAEIDQIICSGPLQKGKQTYALLANRAAKIKRLSKDEALTKLAFRYFSSHGPATLTDYCNWSGLPVTEAKKGLESVKSKLLGEKVGDQEYWWKDLGAQTKTDSLFLLPAYDEYIIAYKDRSACLSAADRRKIMIGNGLFRPIIVAKGNVTGAWKRSLIRNKLVVETELFREHTKAGQNLLKKQIVQYVLFYGKEAG